MNVSYPDRACRWDMKVFSPKREWQVFCSVRCGNNFRARARYARLKSTLKRYAEDITELEKDVQDEIAREAEKAKKAEKVGMISGRKESVETRFKLALDRIKAEGMETFRPGDVWKYGNGISDRSITDYLKVECREGGIVRVNKFSYEFRKSE